MFDAKKQERPDVRNRVKESNMVKYGLKIEFLNWVFCMNEYPIAKRERIS